MSAEDSGGWSESLIIAAVPVAAYLADFLYEWRYAAYFRIPIRWIHVDLSLLLGFVVLFGLSFVVGLDMFLKVFRRAGGHPAVTPPFAWAIFVLGAPILGAFWPVGLVVAIACAAVLEAVIRLRRRYMRRSLGVQQPAEVPISGISESLMRTYAVRAFTAASVWYLVLAAVLGHVAARSQTTYHVRPGSPEVAILATYADRLVGATFDRRTKRLGRELHLIPLSDEVVLREESVGPLRPPD